MTTSLQTFWLYIVVMLLGSCVLSGVAEIVDARRRARIRRCQARALVRAERDREKALSDGDAAFSWED